MKTLVGVLFLSTTTILSAATGYYVHNLVSDQQGVADFTDPLRQFLGACHIRSKSVLDMQRRYGYLDGVCIEQHSWCCTGNSERYVEADRSRSRRQGRRLLHRYRCE